MEKDFRYKIRHIGDAFADQVEKLGAAIKGSARGITLTYNVDGLRTEKKKVVNMIGRRMVALRNKKTAQNLIYGDEGLTNLFNRLDKIQAQIDVNIKERERRLCRGKA